ncbi:hypothetical protein [Streptomyces collinus]|uniref:hypothetical protein n=1 Tax=Streptomyces collinus TaxID=42684 RepID=UPI00106250B1
MGSNGFPKGDFYIKNVKTGLVITAVPGGTTVLADANNRGGDEIVYTRTADPRPVLTVPLPPGKNELQGWYYDETVEHLSGRARNILVSRKKFDDRGRFVLNADSGDMLQMNGAGRDGHTQWTVENGMIWAEWDYSPHYVVAQPGLDNPDEYTLAFIGQTLLPMYESTATWEFTPFP